MFLHESRSQPAPVDDKIVVSDIGEQWSPNNPPDKTAPIHTYIDASKETA